MDKFWLKSYPQGVPAEIDPNEFRSLKELVETSCAKFADYTAFVQMGRSMSYRELDDLSRGFAAWLQKTAGLRKGDRIAIMLPNVLQYPIAMLGALRAGLTIVNTNPLYTARELEHQLTDAGATTIVILENFAGVLQEVLARTKVKRVLVTAVGDFLRFPKSWIVNYVVRHRRKQVPAWRIEGALDFRSVVISGRGLALDPVDVTHEDIAFLQYTGGTTGVSKGAVLTHGNMVANVLQGRAWFQGGLTAGSTYVIALPLYHIFSLTANLLLFMTIGARGILIVNPRDFVAFLRELKQHAPNFFMGVNTLFNALMNTPGFDAVDWSKLHGTVGGGMAVQGAVAERWKKMTGCVLSQGWGLTETSPIAAMNPLRGTDFNGSIGLPVSSTEISIRDDDGRALAIGAIGEICVRGPQVMRGYWNRPDETEKVMLPDGWLRTGDIGRMDANGFVYIEDRKKDMILVSGFNVYPNEVESVAATHPGVLEAAAVAQPDERSGEVVALFVVRKDPNLTEKDVIDHTRKSLTGYKVPKRVYFKTELPKTNVGKILRRALREELPRS
ncbi:MAG: AMP-binding protein [Steroidobacteraceae bacterium]